MFYYIKKEVIKMLKNTLLREIGSITRCIQYLSDIEYRKFNLQKGQFMYLVRIIENPGINQRDLTNMMNVDKTSVAKVVVKLENEGYIHREKSEIDKRMMMLYPKDKAKDLYDEFIRMENENLDLILEDFDDESVGKIIEDLRLIKEKINVKWLEKQ
jgi:DNA-binding MarR family transcriptional regulator